MVKYINTYYITFSCVVLNFLFSVVASSYISSHHYYYYIYILYYILYYYIISGSIVVILEPCSHRLVRALSTLRPDGKEEQAKAGFLLH